MGVSVQCTPYPASIFSGNLMDRPRNPIDFLWYTTPVQMKNVCRCSSVVEQRFCKPPVRSSNLLIGSIRYFPQRLKQDYKQLEAFLFLISNYSFFLNPHCLHHSPNAAAFGSSQGFLLSCPEFSNIGPGYFLQVCVTIDSMPLR